MEPRKVTFRMLWETNNKTSSQTDLSEGRMGYLRFHEPPNPWQWDSKPDELLSGVSWQAFGFGDL